MVTTVPTLPSVPLWSLFYSVLVEGRSLASKRGGTLSVISYAVLGTIIGERRGTVGLG